MDTYLGKKESVFLTYKVTDNSIIKSALEKENDVLISANDIKTKGISFIEELIKKYNEVFVSVRGKKKFAIISLEEFERLKEAELEKIIREAEEDYKAGRFVKETSDEHFKKLRI